MYSPGAHIGAHATLGPLCVAMLVIDCSAPSWLSYRTHTRTQSIIIDH